MTANNCGTYTGLLVNPLGLDDQDVSIIDIAWSLSHQCRFNGHCKRFYSVAEHSLNVASFFRDRAAKKRALLHDAAEAYLGDVVKPLKQQLVVVDEGKQVTSFEKLEERILARIFQHFNMKFEEEKMREIEKADLLMLESELKYLFPAKSERWIERLGKNSNQSRTEGPIYYRPVCYQPEVANELFLAEWWNTERSSTREEND